MRNDLLHDLLIVNRQIFDAAIAGIQQQAHEDIDGALREASIWASELQSAQSTMTFEQVCEAAEKRAANRILQIRGASRDRIQELKQELHQREQSIRAFCENQSQRKPQEPHTPPDANRGITQRRKVQPELAPHKPSPGADGK
jgi:hypothetical protein